jgi:RNA polymerase sigma-70 factor (ECF subfamily)
MPGFHDLQFDETLVAGARDGDPAAQEAIFRCFEKPVATLARRLVPERAVAEELAQDVFVEVLLHLDRYAGRGSFAGWVRAITVNRCLMHLRSPWRRGQRWLWQLAGTAAAPSLEEQPARRDPADERLDLERALAALGDTARLVVWLHDVEGYTHAEIGALLGGSASQSKSQLSRAHARLRTLLDPQGDTLPWLSAPIP